MADDERRRTEQLRGVEIDALLRSEPAEAVQAGDATAQIRVADLRRLEDAAAAATMPSTERLEAVADCADLHRTEKMAHVRPTQQSGQLRSVLDQDLREVPVEPLVPKVQGAVPDPADLRESAELATIAGVPVTDRINLADEAATVRAQPAVPVVERSSTPTSAPIWIAIVALAMLAVVAVVMIAILASS